MRVASGSGSSASTPGRSRWGAGTPASCGRPTPSKPSGCSSNDRPGGPVVLDEFERVGAECRRDVRPNQDQVTTRDKPKEAWRPLEPETTLSAHRITKRSSPILGRLVQNGQTAWR